MSKMELARLAGVSAGTIDRIERGEACQMNPAVSNSNVNKFTMKKYNCNVLIEKHL